MIKTADHVIFDKEIKKFDQGSVYNGHFSGFILLNYLLLLMTNFTRNIQKLQMETKKYEKNNIDEDHYNTDNTIIK